MENTSKAFINLNWSIYYTHTHIYIYTVYTHTLTDHFIRQHKLLIRQSHGSSISAFRCGEDDLLKFKPSIRMGKNGDLSDFERGMVVGVRRAGRSIFFFKCLVDVRGQRRMSRLVRDDRKATVTQITTCYNQGMQNTISKTSNPEADQLQQQKTTLGAAPVS